MIQLGRLSKNWCLNDRKTLVCCLGMNLVSLRTKSELGGAPMGENRIKLQFCTTCVPQTTVRMKHTCLAICSANSLSRVFENARSCTLGEWSCTFPSFGNPSFSSLSEFLKWKLWSLNNILRRGKCV